MIHESSGSFPPHESLEVPLFEDVVNTVEDGVLCLFESQIVPYTASMLPSERAKALENHLAGCDLCSMLLLEMKKLDEAIDSGEFEKLTKYDKVH